ncbi:MAG TPA: TetR/AcrR family transcriptional regulator [Syntrophales bacterium]|nr:TetR/AcrR family transcriptional regulator [Syntrophales bacterium]HPI57924.1 TetR/AcrR family transcriptional regulator [Syntrophales bacterium]HPN24597.1 TetR/AcrR family transcriptional regulator [Syntrophales bacterium]HQM28903.1 TetR/AcrR family transcriptional regulator [Syntrophales bacterium]
MGIAERRQGEKESRVQQILDSAAAVFYEKGFEAATIEDIAARAEISKAAIYLYFKSKEDLYYGLVGPALDRLSSRLVRIAGDGRLDPEIKIKKMVDATHDFCDKDPDTCHLVSRYNAAEFPKLLSRKKLDHLTGLMRSNLYQLERAIADVVQKGKFRRVDSRITSIIIWNAFMGIVQFQENRMEKEKKDYRRLTVKPPLNSS